MKRAFACLSALGAAALLIAPAAAFDCGKAASRTEKAICADPGLKKADDAMAAGYDDVLKRTPKAHLDMLKAAQLGWLKARDEQCNGEAPDAAQDGEFKTCLLEQTTQRSEVFAAKAEAGPGMTKTLTPIFVWRETTAKICSANVTAYEFGTAATTPGEKAYDARVEELLAGWAKDYGERDNPDFECYYEAGPQLAYASNDVLSVNYGISMYQGGAHPSSDAVAILVDLKGGTIPAFKDVFDDTAKKPLIEACTAAIKQTKSEMANEIEDAESKKEALAGLDEEMKGYVEAIEKGVTDFSRWTINADGASVYFAPYELGSYAEGPYNCELKKDLLQKQAGAKGWLVP